MDSRELHRHTYLPVPKNVLLEYFQYVVDGTPGLLPYWILRGLKDRELVVTSYGELYPWKLSPIGQELYDAWTAHKR